MPSAVRPTTSSAAASRGYSELAPLATHLALSRSKPSPILSASVVTRPRSESGARYDLSLGPVDRTP